jgi:acyl-[acyl-carrier-protein] desaturase
VTERSHTSGEAAEAQEYLARLPDRIRKLAERSAARKGKAKPVRVQFSWVFNRQLDV